MSTLMWTQRVILLQMKICLHVEVETVFQLYIGLVKV